MYYKINKPGVVVILAHAHAERKGLVEVRYDCFLESGDHKYNEHHFAVAPTGTTNFVVRIVGHAVTGNEVFVNIDQTYLELA